MRGGRRTAAIAASTFFLAPRRRRFPQLTTLVQQPRYCSSESSAKKIFHYRPHQLSGQSERNVELNLGASTKKLSSVHITLDSLAPPSTLTADTAVEYLAALRGLHRSLGIMASASRVRWQAREFLIRGMPKPNDNETQALWTMTEELACAITVSCAHFEISILECPYGNESVEFLQHLWQERQSSSSPLSSICSCEEAVLLGRLTMAVLDLLVNRVLYLDADGYELLSQLLCRTLLPAVMCVLQDDVLFTPPKGEEGEDKDLTNTQAAALTVLLSSLTKAAVAQWARRSSDSEDGENVALFGTPTSLPPSVESGVRIPRAIKVPIVPLSLAKLARIVQHYATGLTPLRVRETALPLLRFFTLTQCVPLFVEPHDECGPHGTGEGSSGGCEQGTNMASLVASVTRVLQASMDNRTFFVSHQVSNITSTYARILSFSPIQSKKEVGNDGHAVVASTSWCLFEILMMGLKSNILYHVEPLSPTVVMPQLCECVTAFSKKYLFSDLAALLNALAKIFHVLCEQHNNLWIQQQQQQLQQKQDQPVKVNGTRSRFERRRTTASVVRSSMLPKDEGGQSSLTSPALPLTGVFFVSNDDISEIEGELEVLLDACVAVMERHMLSFWNTRQALVPRSGIHSSTSGASASDKSLKVLKEERGIAFSGVGVSLAKALGGRSRRLKKSVSSRELVMIAEGVHALSWRPFVAFQERLLALLSSSVGQSETTPSQYACLVRFVLRAPPVLPSVIFHSVGDRLKRVIHAEAVTTAVSKRNGNEGGKEESTNMASSAEEVPALVIAAAHARSLQDTPLSLYDACAVVFAFAQKMKKSALPLLHDFFVRTGKRVFSDCETSPEPCQDAATCAALMMFVASATWVLCQSAPILPGDHGLTFIAASRDYAAEILAASTPEEKLNAAKSFFSLSDLAYACMMLEPSCDSQGSAQLTQVRCFLQETYKAHTSQCDSMEVTQFITDYLAIPPLDISYGDAVKMKQKEEENEKKSKEFLQLSPWMISSLRLRDRLEGNTRLSTVMFFPLLGGGRDDISRVLNVTRMYCRTFATLVTTLRLLAAADVELLKDDAVLEVVFRKVSQLTRRTARPLDLFQFFELYGDYPQMASACLSELLPEARCFEAKNAFVPIVQVNAAVRAVRRLRKRELRQRWFATMTPLIVSAVTFSREPLDVVLELTEHIGNDDPELLQSVLKSSASMQMIHETFRFTVSGDVLLRLLQQLQNASTSHPTVRGLHAASRELLQKTNAHIPLKQLAQAMLLPSVEGTTLGRRLKKLFVFRVTVLLGITRPRASRPTGQSAVKSEEDPPTTTLRCSHWDESLDCLELEHWMLLLRFSHVAEPSSYRLLMTIKHDMDVAARRMGKLALSSTPAKGEKAAAPEVAAGSSHEGAVLLLEGKEEDPGYEKGVEEWSDKRHRSLAFFYAFSDHTILCLRRSLGAFQFITLVCELLHQASIFSPDLAAFSRESNSHERGCMYDGSASPLSDERVWPFLRLAIGLVEEMSADLGGFLRREREQGRRLNHGEPRTAQNERNEELEEISVDIGAILKFLNVLDTYDPRRRERRLLLLSSASPSRLSLSHDTPNVFDDVMQIPHRYLYRLLLQLPQHWGKVTPAASFVDTPRVRLQNISSVFDYCSAPTEFHSPFGTPDASVKAHFCLLSIFGADRPLINDVWMPIAALQSQQRLIDRSVKAQLFVALMRCLVRDGESLAATRPRLAELGPRDLARVAQTFLGGGGGGAVVAAGNDDHCREEYDKWRSGRRAEAVIALELLTDMLPSASAEDLHDIVMMLLPPPSAEPKWEGDKRQTPHAPLYEEVAEVRRFLVHVPVVMGNDTERFPLPVLYGILLRLHEPHRLIAPAAAQMMLTNLHAVDETTKGQELPEHEGEEEDVGEQVLEDAVSGPRKKQHYKATVALLRRVVSSSSSFSL
ncbi:hypothetical protein C3747_54g190 [Trypanosoma cruzi]|uniref:Uncharacterized protein n=2 Tax=Trypanosoma cruzi TaxID=5693 RepID=Q4DCR3_TRYCC|nr:hypothetical protein, conserved [Trypanosoma cruzi]EAN90315.1 hypothetical protein, conserved [Trypanosoma cruzi]PWV12064.1 hypothetical protein C3747_54g190 [Trypanosoma cruzi]RNC43276.1 hypothetical protein TcCL_NonESM07063 [Trypanosoma cruzi]|eukprot:XP_812166.1 hypothetical protein [Trypanosoma cruzi strain CL Brener]